MTEEEPRYVPEPTPWLEPSAYRARPVRHLPWLTGGLVLLVAGAILLILGLNGGRSDRFVFSTQSCPSLASDISARLSVVARFIAGSPTAFPAGVPPPAGIKVAVCTVTIRSLPGAATEPAIVARYSGTTISAYGAALRAAGFTDRGSRQVGDAQLTVFDSGPGPYDEAVLADLGGGAGMLTVILDQSG